MRRLAAAALFLGIFRAQTAKGQSGVPAKVSYHQDRPGLDTPHYTITVAEDGTSQYHAELAPPNAIPGDDLPVTAPVLDRSITFTPVTTAKVFELARAVNRFGIVCESKVKNIANTGSKVLSYSGPEGKSECAYNYSEVKQITELTDIFQSAALTLEMGRRLDFKRRFDRLGLDADMISLGNMLEGHQAIEVGIIAPTLHAIANDTELLQRVRLRAAKMLEEAGISGQ